MKFNKIAQMPGMDMGMPPMGGPPTAPMAAPGAAPAATTREEIGSPLRELGQILYDVDIETLLSQKIGSETSKVAQDIWVMYGGNIIGGIEEEKTGKRIDKQDVSPENEESEQEKTEDSRWERLPEGQNISDITSLDELEATVQGIAADLAAKKKKEQAGGGAGGGMPMASIKLQLIKLADRYDSAGRYSFADILEKPF
jgi:hypothetical protein